jgi:glycerophosphoryl diester phosphodiesterase
MRWRTLHGAEPQIIAHRGASGYRPEHTLDGYALAAAQGADAIEPDLVVSRDGVLYARHDLGLARSTDIASRSEFRARASAVAGQFDWWISDFDSAEIDTLRALQPMAERDTSYDGHFIVPRFSHVLELAQEAGRQRGRPLVVDAEIKHPEYFEALGIDVLEALRRDLEPRELSGAQAPVWLECFDHAFLRSACHALGNPCFALVETVPAVPEARAALLRELATWTRGVAAQKYLLWDTAGACSSLVDDAHAAGLQLHAWTFRDDRSPAPFASAREELFAAFALGVDALFCDFPDTAVAARAEYETAIPR